VFLSLSFPPQQRMSKVYTEQDIASHNKKGNLWIAIAGHVYNISEFISDHPGGEEILLDVGGRDATKDFEDVGHSPDANNLMKKYLIGDLKVEPKVDKKDAPKATTVPPAKSSSSSSSSSPSSASTSNLIFVPVLILLLAVIAYYTLASN